MRKTHAACFHRRNKMVPTASVLKEIVGVAIAVPEASSKLSCYELSRFIFKNVPYRSVTARENAGSASFRSDVENIGRRDDCTTANPASCRIMHSNIS